MKSDLVQLIDKTEYIDSQFHAEFFGAMENQIINDIPDFQIWKQQLFFELHLIYDNTGDKFIEGIISLLDTDWLGWDDKRNFNDLKSKLIVVKDNLKDFYPEEERSLVEDNYKTPKIFISHSTEDSEYIKAFVELLEFIGIQSTQLFCSSVPGYDIPEGESIYEYLKEQFEEFDLHMFYMLSEKYYSSPAALNEMGAAWILKKKYTTILLPGFEYKKIKGAIDPYRISVSLDEDRTLLRNHLRQIKNDLESEFGIEARPEQRWDVRVDEFIEEINHLSEVK